MPSLINRLFARLGYSPTPTPLPLIECSSHAKGRTGGVEELVGVQHHAASSATTPYTYTWIQKIYFDALIEGWQTQKVLQDIDDRLRPIFPVCEQEGWRLSDITVDDKSKLELERRPVAALMAAIKHYQKDLLQIIGRLNYGLYSDEEARQYLVIAQTRRNFVRDRYPLHPTECMITYRDDYIARYNWPATTRSPRHA